MRSSPLAATLVAIFAPATLAAAPTPPPVAAGDRAAIVSEIAAALNTTYVFPETAQRMEARLRERLATGAYDDAADLVAFTDRLTEDLQAVSEDRHLQVRWDPARPDDGGEGPTEEEQRSRFADEMRRDNYCFRRVEHLPGNVGYLKLDCFAPAELGGATAVAAMNLLAGIDALILDLRENGGGSPSMIQLLTSYLFAERTHLNSFYVRRSDSTIQFWTQESVVGPKLADVPVWVLVSGNTFSAAEEFSYNLRALERATIVGETTGGGAHPVESFRLSSHPVVMALPYGRAINPVTGTNWEGTGVKPHREVPTGDALPIAHEEALGRLAAAESDVSRKATLEFAQATLRLRRAAPVTLSAKELDAYVGQYGPRTISRDGTTLVYRRGDGPRTVLIAAGDDEFLYGADDSFRLRFERNASGRVLRLVGLYADGRREPHDRESAQ